MSVPHAQDQFEYLEFFAGCGQLSKSMTISGRRTGSLDILYPVAPKSKKKHNSNPMDMNSPSGFAFLAGKVELGSSPLNMFFSLSIEVRECIIIQLLYFLYLY